MPSVHIRHLQNIPHSSFNRNSGVQVNLYSPGSAQVRQVENTSSCKVAQTLCRSARACSDVTTAAKTKRSANEQTPILSTSTATAPRTRPGSQTDHCRDTKVYLKGLLCSIPSSCIAKRMRRWTGLSPSRTSGSALPTITDIAYCHTKKNGCQPVFALRLGNCKFVIRIGSILAIKTAHKSQKTSIDAHVSSCPK